MAKVTMDERRINELIMKPGILNDFPFLTMRITASGCCGRASRQVPDYEGIRAALGKLDEDKAKRLKDVLSAEEVTIHYKEGNGVTTKTY